MSSRKIFLPLLVVIFLLVVAAASILQNIQMLELKQTLTQKANYYAQLKSQNNDLKLQIERLATFGKIKHIAESKGMRFPRKDELVKIVVVVENSKKNTKSTFIEKIEDSFKAYALEKRSNSLSR